MAVIAQDSKEKIYLVGQDRYAVGNIYSWEVVTGSLKKGDNPLRKAKQELEEETGLLAKKWIRLGYFYPLNGYSSEKCFVYLAEDLTVAKANPEATENITVKKKSLKEILKMIKENKITCGMTVAVVNKFLLYKNKINL